MSTTERRGADILALGLAATVAVWSLLYVAALPPLQPPLWLVAFLIAACLQGVGYLAGRSAGRGAGGGAAIGLVIGAMSLLVLSGMLGGGDPEQRRQGFGWFGVFLAAAIILPVIGALLGRRPSPKPRNWTARLAWVTAGTTLLMLVAGGIVTGLEAGLAVKGWLVPEGHLLLTFPIALMRRDLPTFVEHAHRLWGVLVGLCTIVLVIHVWKVEPRRWVCGVATAILAAVVVQGVLGGTRVTQGSVALGIIHGIVGIAVFSAMVLLAMMLSDAWRAARPLPRPGAKTDRALSAALLVAVLVQIALGACFRHLQPLPGTPRGALMGLLHGHSFLGSMAVLVLALFCGVRAWGISADQPLLRRAGMALVHTTLVQVLLGVVSFLVVPKGPRPPDSVITGLEVGFTTAHQVMGAVLLAAAVSLFAWQRRLLARE